MKKIIIIPLMFLLMLGTVFATLTLENVSFTSASNNATLSFNKSVNVSNVSIGNNSVTLTDFQFTNGDNFTISNNSIVNSLSVLNWTETNSFVDSSNFLHYFRFNLTGSLLSNWSFDNYSTVNNELTLFFTAIGTEGVKSWFWEKLGYVSAYFGFTQNYSTYNNITYNVQQATISLNVRDKRTFEIINNTNFSIELIGSVGIEDVAINGTLNISNLLLLSGEYRIVVSNPNYFTEDIFFNFTNQEIIELDIYMSAINETNAGVVIISVVDGLGQAVPSAIVQALQWNANSSQYVRVSEGQTGLDGKATLNVILEDKVYIFRAILNGISADSPSYRLLITDNGKIITIPLASAIGERTYLFGNLIYSITETSLVGNTSTIEFDWTDQTGFSQTICLNVYRYIGLHETRLSTSCTNGVSGIYTQAFLLNTSQNIKIKGEVKIGDAYYPLKTFDYPADNSFPDILQYLKFEFVVIPLLFLLSIALGIKMESLHVGAFLLVVSSGVSLWLVPTLITGGIVAFLDFMGFLIIWGAVGGKK